MVQVFFLCFEKWLVIYMSQSQNWLIRNNYLFDVAIWKLLVEQKKNLHWNIKTYW